MSTEKTTRATILLVDDNTDNLNVLLDYLADSDFETLIAPDGERALQQIEYVRPDLILLDVMMPGIDGFETCRRLKANETTKDIPVLFLTALSETADKIKGFEAGGVDYITKPFQYEEVFARVNAHLTIRRQEKQLREKNTQLEELDATKDKFFSIISHDLKNLLAGLINYPEIVQEQLETYSLDDIKKALGAIQRSHKKLYALLENLLTWSRIQRGMMTFQPERFNVRDIVIRNVSLFTTNARQKQIALKNSIEKEIFVYADIKMVDTVVRNLISNALKFTDAGGTVDVSATHDEHSVEVSVSDTGAGIPARSLPKLLRIDAAYQTSGTAGEQGTGLGLILCKDLVEKNGGKIRVESEEGQGTTFSFTLPGRYKDEA